MQAKIGVKKSVLKPIRYNEQKVAEGKAEKIHAENFLKDHDHLSKEDILERFRQRSSFNERMEDDGVHFSLNFGKQENLGNEKMTLLANRYMTGMGFEDQPYVVYKHNDAGHTHLHIVVTSVRANGDRIDLHPRDFLNSVIFLQTTGKRVLSRKARRREPGPKRRFLRRSRAKSDLWRAWTKTRHQRCAEHRRRSL